ncbi:MAG TPA: hypothetical protein VL281_09205 [Mycobacteriales bacterium]|jgi:hypothetical protein|nr:hypothetical protein [Mycobacteriales bacterium]
MKRPRLDLPRRLPRYVVELVIGFVLAGLVTLAFTASVSSVPFIYQGF